MKETIISIHSILGAIVFITGFLQFILKKQGAYHRWIGRLYLFAWIGLLSTGAYIGSLFITIVGVFGFYYVVTGIRFAMLKGKAVQLFDKIVYSIGLIFAIALLGYAIQLYLRGDMNFAIISFVFGCIFTMSSVQDIMKYILNKPGIGKDYGKMDWYFNHFGRMVISFIAALSAYTSIQQVFQSTAANFLVPVVVGVLYKNILERHYKKKFSIS